MTNNVVRFEDLKLRDYKLVSPIDETNQTLVSNLERYIEALPQNYKLKLIYNQETDKANFIFNNIQITEDLFLFPGFDDIAFLICESSVIGHIIFKFSCSRIILETKDINNGLKVQTVEKFIPQGYNIDRLVTDYITERFNKKKLSNKAK